MMPTPMDAELIVERELPNLAKLRKENDDPIVTKSIEDILFPYLTKLRIETDEPII
jgi:hypothetical protein